ncbi:MAG: hypothetical protein ACRBCI_15675 [Cellvibrionaceae bacterium]
MIKRISIIFISIILSTFMSHGALAKGSTLVDGSGKPVKSSKGCVKVTKSGKTDFHYSKCHKIKPKKV